MFVLIYNYKKQKSKETDEDEPDEELDSVDDAYGIFNKQVKKELQVPFDAPEVEVFATMYSKNSDKKEKLCETCLSRLETNPMRILDCKSEICQGIGAGAPRSVDFLCGECQDHTSDHSANETDNSFVHISSFHITQRTA